MRDQNCWRRGFERSDGERGSIIPLFTIVLLVAVAAMALIVALAAQAGRVSKAQWAADAAALAVAAEGRSDAGTALAEAHGAVLVTVSVVPDGVPLSELGVAAHGATISPSVVVVEVERDGIRARAAAARFFAPPP
jgi:Flp pilus assembly protein TadG